jgi:type II restriction enzyme
MTWETDVLAIIRNHWSVGEEFTLFDLYRYETDLASLHPTNRFVRSRVRQTLQTLRDKLIIEFIDNRGAYRRRI